MEERAKMGHCTLIGLVATATTALGSALVTKEPAEPAAVTNLLIPVSVLVSGLGLTALFVWRVASEKSKMLTLIAKQRADSDLALSQVKEAVTQLKERVGELVKSERACVESRVKEIGGLDRRVDLISERIVKIETRLENMRGTSSPPVLPEE
jgi:hypothetical protein